MVICGELTTLTVEGLGEMLTGPQDPAPSSELRAELWGVEASLPYLKPILKCIKAGSSFMFVSSL